MKTAYQLVSYSLIACLALVLAAGLGAANAVALHWLFHLPFRSTLVHQLAGIAVLLADLALLILFPLFHVLRPRLAQPQQPSKVSMLGKRSRFTIPRGGNRTNARQ